MNLDVILEFLKEHYDLILGCLSFIISVVILIVKKRPVFNNMDAIKEDILEVLPSLIVQVENPGFGSGKKANVMELVKVYLEKKYHFYEFDTIKDFVGKAIENILETPQKKG